MNADPVTTVELVTAIGTAVVGVISAVGVILIALMGRKVAEVEKQGNSVALELKRINMVIAKRLARATKDRVDYRMAKEATDVYDAAKVEADNANRK